MPIHLSKSALLSGLLLTVLIAPTSIMSNPVETVQITFESPQEAENWVIVNDTVMGGRSAARVEVSDNRLYFFGLLSLENNGGFASTRRIGDPQNWQSSLPLKVKLKGDGRAYQLRIRTNRGFDGVAYVANFQTNAEQQVVEFSEADFSPQWRGRLVRNAPDLDFADIRQIGVMLADKSPGTFKLELSAISQVSD
jgi:monofunctional biosynthetic peptidoglycan transglycosylase